MSNLRTSLLETPIPHVVEESNMADDTPRVEIGVLEKTEPWKLESRFFPSKVGGKPAWLDLKNINIDVTCKQCSKPCILLCQVYAPLPEQEGTFHRTIYVFICKDPECSKPNENGNFIVYRCQLDRVNEFYSTEDPADKPDWCSDVTVDKYVKTCVVCGCFAPHQCGKCKSRNYCSRDHQMKDWEAGHNKACGSAAAETGPADILFPEFEILSESEIMDSDDKEMLAKRIEKTEEERLREYKNYVSQFKAGSLSSVDPKIMEGLSLRKEDKYFSKFKERLKICSDQVMRYGRGGEPLWIAKPNMSDVPRCEVCGSERQFEFQIMPTLLNSLNVDSIENSIDWGTLLVYTCSKSCTGGASYKKEFLWKQDV